MDDECWSCGGPGMAVGICGTTGGRYWCPVCTVKWVTAAYWIADSYAEYLKARRKGIAGEVKRYEADPVDFTRDSPAHPLASSLKVSLVLALAV